MTSILLAAPLMPGSGDPLGGVNPSYLSHAEVPGSSPRGCHHVDELRLGSRSLSCGRDTASLLLEGGEGTKADVLLDIDYDRARMAVRNLQTEFEVARRRLAFAVGYPELPIGQVDDNLTVAIPPANLESLRQYVAATHPDMSVARLETRRSQFLLRRAEVQPIPSLNLMGGYQRHALGRRRLQRRLPPPRPLPQPARPVGILLEKLPKLTTIVTLTRIPLKNEALMVRETIRATLFVR
jgi:hypothetical protein